MNEVERYRGALLGLAAGDAIGTTLEFMPPGKFKPLTDMIGGGPFGLDVGQWTDDTSMALCLADSLVQRRGFDPVDQTHSLRPLVERRVSQQYRPVLRYRRNDALGLGEVRVYRRAILRPGQRPCRRQRLADAAGARAALLRTRRGRRHRTFRRKLPDDPRRDYLCRCVPLFRRVDRRGRAGRGQGYAALATVFACAGLLAGAPLCARSMKSRPDRSRRRTRPRFEAPALSSTAWKRLYGPSITLPIFATVASAPSTSATTRIPPAP